MRYFPVSAIFATLALILSAPLRAELPPSVYQRMQEEAPEKIVMETLRVEIRHVQNEGQHVVIMGVIKKVDRSASGLKSGEFVTIQYLIPDRPEGWVGPGNIPLLSEQEETVAFLRRIDQSDRYEPAAGAMSFSEF
jgi:hypothetical protein